MLSNACVKADDFEHVFFSSDKQINFATVTEQARNCTLPSVFWAKDYYPFNVKKMLVVSDFELMEKLFRRPDVSDRVTTKK